MKKVESTSSLKLSEKAGIDVSKHVVEVDSGSEEEIEEVEESGEEASSSAEEVQRVAVM